MTDTIPVQAPDGIAEVFAHYGDPKIYVRPDGSWGVDQEWEAANLTTIHHPLLPFGKLYVHKLIAVPLLRLLDRWQARIEAGDPYRLLTIGCFNPRAIRGDPHLISLHSLAIAVDVNADTNPLIEHCPIGDPRRDAEGAKDLPDLWLDDARAEGFFSGCDFTGRYDPQHLQLATGC